MDKEFEPLFIRGVRAGMPGEEHKLDIAKHTVKAVEYACEKQLKYIVAVNIMSPTIGGLNMITSLAMSNDDYLENLDGCLPTLEENEEYEYCAKVIELKKVIPNTEFKFKNLNKNIIDAISEL